MNWLKKNYDYELKESVIYKAAILTVRIEVSYEMV